MPMTPEERQEYNKQYYQTNINKKHFKKHLLE